MLERIRQWVNQLTRPAVANCEGKAKESSPQEELIKRNASTKNINLIFYPRSYHHFHSRDLGLNDAVLAKIPVAIVVPKEKASIDPWAVDVPKAILRSVFAGITVPIATTPLTQFEANISIKKGFKVAWDITMKQPWKGYKLAVVTNTLRSGLLFNITPLAKNYLEKNNFTPTQAIALGGAFAGGLEASIMSMRFLFMQKLHTTSANSCKDVMRGMSRQEFYKSWGIACRYSMARDVVSWPLWALTVDKIEKQLLVTKQEETVIKWWEQFIIGATAGVVVAPISFPIHGALRRRLDQPNVSLYQDLSRAWNQAKLSKVPDWEFMENPYFPKSLANTTTLLAKQVTCWKFMAAHCYTGFPASLITLTALLGMTNLAKHAADVCYDDCKKAAFFKPKVTSVSVEKQKVSLVSVEKQAEDDNTFLLKMGSC